MVRQQRVSRRRSDMWIHEGWTTYLEVPVRRIHVRARRRAQVRQRLQDQGAEPQPIITPRGIHREPPQDMYFKGALFLNTLRSVVDDDRQWFALIHDFYQHFKYQNIMTEDVVAYFNQQTGMNLTPIFDQYLRHADVPMLELKFDEPAGTVAYRWKADEKDFAMPVRVGNPDAWQLIRRPPSGRRCRSRRRGTIRGRDRSVLRCMWNGDESVEGESSASARLITEHVQQPRDRIVERSTTRSFSGMIALSVMRDVLGADLRAALRDVAVADAVPVLQVGQRGRPCRAGSSRAPPRRRGSAGR